VAVGHARWEKLLYSVGSGMIIVNAFNNGGVGIFACGGGQVQMIANVGGSFSAGTPHNQSGSTNIFYEASFGRYQVQNEGQIPCRS
jgi:hypothetical protein